MRKTDISKSDISRHFATITAFFGNKIVSERMENFHYLNGVQCLQLAHDYDMENKQCADNFSSDFKNPMRMSRS